MVAAVAVVTPPVGISPILRKPGVILFRYGRPVPSRFKSAADASVTITVETHNLVWAINIPLEAAILKGNTPSRATGRRSAGASASLSNSRCADELLAAGDSDVLSRCVNRNIFYIIGVIVVIVVVLKLLGLF